MQAAHLSFQEFFTVLAICRDATPPQLPWELPPWWANTMRLGREKGREFSEGLRRAAGAALEQRSVRITIEGNERTAATALGLALQTAPRVEEVRVARYRLQLNELRSGQLISLNLSRSRVSDMLYSPPPSVC